MAVETPIDFLFRPPWIYLLIFIAFGLILWFIITKYGLLKKPLMFKGETLEQIIHDRNLKPILKKFGRKLKNGRLVFQFQAINIKRAVDYEMAMQVMKNDKKGIQDPGLGFQEKKYHFLFFKAGGGIFENIPILKWLHPDVEYFVIDNKPNCVEKDPQNDIWNFKQGVFPHTWGKVWIISKEGLEFLTELCYKRTQEFDKEESTNALKRFIFYNDRVLGKIVAMEREAELEDEKYAKMREPDTSG